MKGYAAPETKAAVEQARLLIDQAEALGEAPEDPLLLFSVLFGSWLAALRRIRWRRGARARDAIPVTRGKAKGNRPAYVGHRLMGISLAWTGDIANAGRTTIRALHFTILPHIVRWRCDLDRTPGCQSCVIRSMALWFLGYPEAALADAEQASREAREIGQAPNFDVCPVFNKF